MPQKIPFFSLKEQTSALRSEIERAVAGVIDETAFVLGPELDRFEEEFARYCGAKFCIGTSCGTSALHLALLANGIGEGDEVITVANTFVATVESIAMTGARPVIIDVHRDTALLDAQLLGDAITERTRAIVPVHLFGQCCDMDPILELASRHDLLVIEDACQAHGATYGEKRAGALGQAAAFSFYPSKNLGAFGEGGAVTTSDAELAARIRGLRHHGQIVKNEHSVLGYNYRLHAIQAAVLRVKLAYLDGWNERRREIAGRYRRALERDGFWMPAEHPRCRSVYHLFPIGCPDLEKTTDVLTRAGIGWGRHYPVAVHLQPAFRDLGYGKGAFPVAESLMSSSLTLPMYPELKDEQVDEVCSVLKSMRKT